MFNFVKVLFNIKIVFNSKKMLLFFLEENMIFEADDR